MRLLESSEPWFAAAQTILVGVAVALAVGIGVRLVARRVLRDEDRAQGTSLAAFWGVVVIFGLVAVARLFGGPAAAAGLLTASNRLFTTLPDLVVALVVVVLGSVLATAVRGAVARSLATRRPRYADALARLASVSVLGIAVLLAARQIGVRTVLLDGLVIAAGGAVLLAFALAAGLGGRTYAEAVAAGRHVETILTVGDLVEVDGRRGRVLRIGGTSVRLGLPGGAVAEIPNPLLLAATVVVFEHDDADVASAASGAQPAAASAGSSPVGGTGETPSDSATVVVVEPLPDVDDEAPTRAFRPAGEDATPDGDAAVGVADGGASSGSSAEREPTRSLDRAALARERARLDALEHEGRPTDDAADEDGGTDAFPADRRPRP